MKLKLSFCMVALLSINAWAFDLLIAKNNMDYKAKVSLQDLQVKKVATAYNRCVPLSLEKLNKNTYVTTHYVIKGSVICTKDVEIYKRESVVFDFGGLQIEQEGKLIYENDKYIRIKKNDGQIEKIYKDGRLK
ncbi:hypothetical protein [Candidatus Marinarcus aquaticus]|uniref:hypothetical protein n=1 Tax=Candidatus Marinarcus aquaticus TaxID=2044504 RepID=UPI00100B31DB|nr:hypothetical protein [Candidatus Marinarcus aquaticus]